MPLIVLAMLINAVGAFMLYASKTAMNPQALLAMALLVFIAGAVTLLYGLRMFFLGDMLDELRKLNAERK